MKFTILGSCSGTEPMPQRRHASVALECGDTLYMFDAGDSCAYTAFNLGIDVRKLKALFISHPHSDHIDGLVYLSYLIRKLHSRLHTVPEHKTLICTPALEVFEGLRYMETFVNAPFDDRYDVKLVADGVVFSDEHITVTARHNAHLGETEEPWHSFSYLIESEGKKILYSGDVKSIAELDGWLDCDLLMMETGHHDPEQVALHLAALEKRPKTLVYVHHGRKMLAEPQQCLVRAREILGENVFVSNDGFSIEV